MFIDLLTKKRFGVLTPFVKTKNLQTGASLVEVMVAILLFAIGTIAVLSMTTGAFQVNDSSRSVDEATNLARTTLGRLLTLPYDDSLLVDNTADGLAGLDNQDASNADFHAGNAAGFISDIYSGSRYEIFWNVANNQPVSGSKTISVLVAWQQNAVKKNVVFKTIRAET